GTGVSGQAERAGPFETRRIVRPQDTEDQEIGTRGDCHVEATLTEATRARAAAPPVVRTIEDHSRCADCHTQGNHQPLAELQACGECHEPVVTSMTKGHEDCNACHLPHEGTVEKTCNDCHEEKYQSRHVTDGATCDSCHRSHGPEGVAEPKACVSCHDQPLPLLHQHEEHQQCSDCHEFHDRNPQRSRSTCVSACHQDLLDHEPQAVSCVGCHPFELDVPDWLRVEPVELKP
ncbi:MAG: hypothetical protein HC923_08270, partial [Myxococcales bacterium]|nr:hypothetical protein [Myxococcales bacterium]